jgi:hypothetical protein
MADPSDDDAIEVSDNVIQDLLDNASYFLDKLSNVIELPSEFERGLEQRSE